MERTLSIKDGIKEIELSDLDYEGAIEISITDGYYGEVQSICLNKYDLISLGKHVQYLIDKIKGMEFADKKCKPMVNADWTYLRCECGKRFEPKG